MQVSFRGLRWTPASKKPTNFVISQVSQVWCRSTVILNNRCAPHKSCSSSTQHLFLHTTPVPTQSCLFLSPLHHPFHLETSSNYYSNFLEVPSLVSLLKIATFRKISSKSSTPTYISDFPAPKPGKSSVSLIKIATFRRDLLIIKYPNWNQWFFLPKPGRGFSLIKFATFRRITSNSKYPNWNQ